MAGVTKALVAVENENFHGDCVFCCESICGLQQTFTLCGGVPHICSPGAFRLGGRLIESVGTVSTVTTLLE